MTLFANVVHYIQVFVRYKYLSIHTCIRVKPRSLQKTIVCVLILQSYEQQKKNQKSALKRAGDRYVCGVFFAHVVAYLSVAFCYWVCIQLFAGDKYATTGEFRIIHTVFLCLPFVKQTTNQPKLI